MPGIIDSRDPSGLVDGTQQLKNNYFTEMCNSSEADSYLRPIDSCITQLEAEGPSRTCKESKEEEEVWGVACPLSSEYGKYKTVTPRLWPWEKGDGRLEGPLQQVEIANFLRTLVYLVIYDSG